ncbi:membrane-spanning 4-domains subfamily A member 4A [Colossoma macropomum]|uniref:membrane-spanning 4-domains subfamily A member 4A n=1 Tax=Colossoma macropomum TaxID=42526 RepID=UPI001863CDDB|nr:membrane-spanning 4-domains subfamily A member 4A [Colossoma macropomum]XP_036439329.1 membrane-spanning 4-domains subfamily A member 4A [Colossoma macropomum]
MATSVTAAAHGVRVVTHIIPLDTTGPPCPSENKESQMKSSLPYMTRMFLKVEPVALGTLQVFIGLVMIAVGIATLVAGTQHGEVPLGLGISCIICGSVTLAAHKGTSLPLIKSTLALNIIGTLLSISGICYFCVELAIRPDLDDCSTYDGYWDCWYMAQRFTTIMDGLNGLLLVFSVLEVCVCITLVVFSCKAGCPASETKMVVKVQTSDQLCHSSHEALLTGEDVGACDHPPAYEP